MISSLGKSGQVMPDAKVLLLGMDLLDLVAKS